MVKTTNGRGPNDELETTEHFRQGYRVTRCSSTGQFVISQVVRALDAPDGPAMVVVREDRPLEGGGVATVDQQFPGDPTEPEFRARWAEAGHAARTQAIPPTPEAD